MRVNSVKNAFPFQGMREQASLTLFGREAVARPGGMYIFAAKTGVAGLDGELSSGEKL